MQQNAIDLVGFAFILGRTSDDDAQVTIEQESHAFKDILQVEMVDTYYDLLLAQ